MSANPSLILRLTHNILVLNHTISVFSIETLENFSERGFSQKVDLKVRGVEIWRTSKARIGCNDA